MQSFISSRELAMRQKRNRTHRIVFIVLCSLTLLVYIAECLLTNTRNTAVMLRVSWISLFLLGGACILFFWYVLRPSKQKEILLESLLSREPDILEGLFFLTGDAIQIPKSVRIRIVRLDTGEDSVHLHLNEEWLRCAPPDGTPVRLQAVGKFITGIEIPEEPAPGKAASRSPSPVLRFLWKAAAFIPPLMLWIMFVLIFGGFVFNQITDTSPRYKITVYADCEVSSAAELAASLEEQLPAPVRMVKVHPFSYAMFGADTIRSADLFIVPASRAEEYRDWFRDVPEDLAFLSVPVLRDGPAGIPVSGAAASYFVYDPDEIYYLFFGKQSLHLPGNEGAEDHLAADAARLLLGIR